MHVSNIKLKVRNMDSPSSGRPVANQYIIEVTDKFGYQEFFQSYDSIIGVWQDGELTLDERYWNYSVTTGKYRNQWLREKKADTEKKIKSGEYKLADLNS